ncbi:hypothetical protein MMC28_003887 [Mycoblastus sanguinarius]|nr:hypothetical protein [Mycoblastus sanguinarius]
MWRTAAVLPLMTASLDMNEFYNDVMAAANTAFLSKLVTNTYTVTLGCMRLFVDTLDGSPIEWAFVAHFGGKMLAMTSKGWTDHYTATFHNAKTGTVVLVSVQAVSAAGVASLGFLQGLDSGGSAIRGAAPIGD